jgi:hypothetical protein
VEARDGSITFTGAQVDENSTDQIGRALRENFPQYQLWLFTSTAPIATTDRPRKHIQLLRDGQLLFKHLPNPDLGSDSISIIRITP